MNRIRMTRFLPALSIVLCSTVLDAAGQERTNLIESPSLETATLGSRLPPGWSGWPQGDTTFRREVVEGGKTGDRCLKISGDGDHGVVFVNNLNLDRNKRYALKGWVRIEGDSNARAQIKFNYFHNYQWLGLTEDFAVTPDQEGWQQLERTDRAEQVPEASMVSISCVLWGKGTAWFDDLELVAYDRNEVAADFDVTHGRSNFPSEFQVLQRRVGEWTTQTTIKPGITVPEGVKSRGEEKIEWKLGKKMIIGNGTRQPGDVESLSMWKYDKQSKSILGWNFDSWGNHDHNPSTGTWDEASQAITFRSADLDGGTGIVTMKLIGDDETRWSGVWKDTAGTVVMEIDGNSMRKNSPNN
jgi:hypothetical protein